MKRIIAYGLLAAMLFSLLGCTDDKTTLQIYYLNSEKNGYAAEEMKFDESGTLINEAIEALLTKPRTKDKVAPVPEGTALLGISQTGAVAEINFSGAFYNTENEIAELLCRYAVVQTACQMPGISGVKILVEGQPLVYQKSGQEVGLLTAEDVIGEQYIQESANRIYVTLYFADPTATYLVPEQRTITVRENETIEKAVLAEIIKGPTRATLQKTVPGDTKIISVETKDNVCFVNLSKEFVEKQAGPELLAIYSVVNSMVNTQLVSQVQFLIEGQRVDTFKNVVFNEPFERDDAIVGPPATPVPTEMAE